MQAQRSILLNLPLEKVFIIKSEDWNDMLSNGQSELTVSYGLLRHLATITVGTTRGILHAKTENTCFNKYHLPTINVIEMISDDLVIKCNQEML